MYVPAALVAARGRRAGLLPAPRYCTSRITHPVDRAVPPVIWVGQFAHLYVRFVSMKRMYIIVEAQGDWHSLSVSVLNRYSTNRVSTMYIQMISYLRTAI